jgi:cell division septal protein FtsQ
VRQRRQQHLLDVKVRARSASARRTEKAVFFVCVFLFVVGLVVAGLLGARRAANALFFENPDYNLQSVELKTDGTLQRDVVLTELGLRFGTNIFSLNLARLEHALRQLPQVEDCTVRRILPGKLVLSVHERQPVAWIAPEPESEVAFNYEAAFLLDKSGVVLRARHGDTQYTSLPLILGVDTKNYSPGQRIDTDEIKAALQLISLNSESLQDRFQIKSVDVSREYYLTVTEKQRATVVFGLDQLPAQLHRLQLLLNYCDDNKRQLQTVNLMPQRNVPVTFVAAVDPVPTPTAEPDSAPKPPEKNQVGNQGGTRSNFARASPDKRSKSSERSSKSTGDKPSGDKPSEKPSHTPRKTSRMTTKTWTTIKT